MANLSYSAGAKLLTLLNTCKPEDLKQQLTTCAQDAKVSTKESVLSALLHHQFATNQKEGANLFPLVYLVNKYHTAPDSLRGIYLARIQEILHLLATENKENWRAEVAFSDIVIFALKNNLPREFLNALVPYIPEERKLALLKEVLIENHPTAVCVFFEAFHEKINLNNYIDLVELALKANHFSVLNGLLNKELLQQADIHIRKKWAEQLIFTAQENTDHALFIKKLLDSGVSLEPTWLSVAIIRKKPHIAALLLKEKANPNFQDETGKTAVHYAAATEQSNFFTLFNYYGADFTIPDAEGNLPEHLTENPTIKARLKNLTHPSLEPESALHTSATGKYTKLAIRGGGVKGAAYPYAIKEAIQKGLFKLEEIDAVAGASAGAITAGLIALNYDENEFEQIMGKVNLLDFVDPIDPAFNQQKEALERLIANFSSGIASGALWTALSPGDVSKAKALIDTITVNKGIMKGDLFLDWIRARIKDKIKDSKLSTFLQEHPELVTFQDLADAGFKDLRVVATDVNRAHAVWFSAKETPNAIVADAIRASMSFPIAFRPHKYYIRVEKGGDFTREIHPDYVDVDLIDGGVMDNYPVRAFDKDMSSKQQTYNPNVLGFYLATPDEKLEFERGIKAAAKKIDGGFGYFSALISSLLYHQEHTHLESTDNERTIYINTRDVGAMDFNASPEKLFQLAQEGRQGVHDFLNRRCGHHPLQALSPTSLQLLVEFGGAKIQKIEPHRIAIHLSQLQLRPQQIVRLYANCTDTELSHLRTLVNPNNSRDEKGNTALHLAYLICTQLQVRLEVASNTTERKQLQAHLSKAQKLRDNLLSINANPNAKNTAGKTPQEMSSEDLVHVDERHFLMDEDKLAIEQLTVRLESAETQSKFFAETGQRLTSEKSVLLRQLQIKEEETKCLSESNERQKAATLERDQKLIEINQTLDTLRKDNLAKLQEIESLRQQFLQKNHDHEQLSFQCQKLKEELRELQLHKMRLEEEQAELLRLRQVQDEKHIALSKQHQLVAEELQAQRQLCETRALEVTTHLSQRSRQEREITDLRLQCKAREEDLFKLQQLHEARGEKLATLRSEHESQKTELSELRQQYTTLGAERDELRRQLSNKERDNGELQRQVSNKDLQIAELRARLRTQIRTQQHGFFKTTLDKLTAHSQTLAEEKESFFSMNHKRKDGKTAAIARLVKKITDEKNSGKTLTQLIEESDSERVLRAGFFSRRTSGMLDQLIEAENREILALS
ncbi:patatin-like phospholipase family protein [Legionella sp.]|uniref:patatin-like phospholipase family protein n=1 Tax=Legionella sp. TaxID=459 RepID=UPI00321FAC0C